MSLVLRLGGLVAALVAVVVVAVPSQASSERGDAPTTIGVRNGSTEFSFYLSRTRVAPGPAFVQYTNTGEDPHDLKLQRTGRLKEYATGVVPPGEIGELDIPKLKPSSTYRLWCSLDGHAAAGMEAVVRVKKKRRGR